MYSIWPELSCTHFLASVPKYVSEPSPFPWYQLLSLHLLSTSHIWIPFISFFLNILSDYFCLPAPGAPPQLCNPLSWIARGLDLRPHAVAPKIFPTHQFSPCICFCSCMYLSASSALFSPWYH